MEGANLWQARMEGANLSRARMDEALLVGARMESVDLCWAQMEGAVLLGAQMGRAKLFEAELDGADLTGAQMERSDLRKARMEGVDLMWAQMDGARLWGAHMEGTNLKFARLTGSADSPNVLRSTHLSGVNNKGSVFRFVDFTGAEFDAKPFLRNAFGDATVILPEAAKSLLPAQWSDEELDDAEFWGRWRGWLDRGREDRIPELLPWEQLAPEGFKDVPAIAPPEDAHWQI